MAATRFPGIETGRAHSLLVRYVSLCLLFAFLSLTPQLPGLAGPNGFFPGHEALEVISNSTRLAKYPETLVKFRFPTLFWLRPEVSDQQLLLVGGGGILSSLLALLGVGSRLPLIVGLTCWISLTHVCSEALQFPWDWFLAEAVFLVSLLPQPGFLRSKAPSRVPRLLAFAIRFFAFRLIFGMGLQKFWDVEGREDCAWADMRYLETFYAWQPMPTPAAWLAHNAGKTFHYLSAYVVKFSQLYLSFAIFAPLPVRALVAIVQVLEQIWIQLCGNFGIFNVLSIGLFVFPLLAVENVDEEKVEEKEEQEEEEEEEEKEEKEEKKEKNGKKNIDTVQKTKDAEEKVKRHDDGIGLLESLILILVESLALCNVVCGSFFLLRPLVLGHPGFTWLSSPIWLFEAKAVSAFQAPLGEYYATAAPVLHLLVATLRAAAPFRLCNPYGIFRTAPGFAPGVKYAVKFQGKTEEGWQSYVLPTSFAQGTGGTPFSSAELSAAINYNGGNNNNDNNNSSSSSSSLALASAKSYDYTWPWFAPHQPRLDHLLFYQGMGLDMGFVYFDNFYFHLLAQEEAGPYRILRGLLRGPSSPATSLLKRGPTGKVKEVRFFFQECKFRSLNIANVSHVGQEFWKVSGLNQLMGLGPATSMWRPCKKDKTDVGPHFSGNGAKLLKKEAKLRRLAAKAFVKYLRQEQIVAPLDLSALVVPLTCVLLVLLSKVGHCLFAKACDQKTCSFSSSSSTSEKKTKAKARTKTKSRKE